MRNIGLVFAALFLAAVFLTGAIAHGVVQAVYSCNAAREAERREQELAQKTDDDYNIAVERIRRGDYTGARELLCRLEDYKDGGVLLHYARARSFFPRTDALAYSTYEELEQIPADYFGDLAEEIAAFRAETEPYRAEKKSLYDAEQERRAEAEKQLKELRQKIREEKIAGAKTHKTPYVGMDREYLIYTQLGMYDISEVKDGVSFYYWTKNGSTFYASVQNGTVVHTGGSTKSHSSSGRSTDPYNASDYAHVDDFYYDHYDDFFNYQDAEDYYDAHN